MLRRGDLTIEAKKGKDVTYEISFGDQTWSVMASELYKLADEANCPRTYEEYRDDRCQRANIPDEFARQLMRNGYAYKLDNTDISDYADEYFTIATCNTYCTTVLQDEVLTDDFLKRHLPRHRCLLRRLTRDLPFNLPISQTGLYEIGNQFAADFIFRNKVEDRLTSVCGEFVREEWLDYSDKRPKELWTLEYALREFVANIDDTEDLPEHLHTPEVFRAIIEIDPMGISPLHYDIEFFRLIEDHVLFERLFWTNLHCMKIDLARQVIEDYHERLYRGFIAHNGVYSGEMAELLLSRWPDIQILWTEDVADYLRNTQFSHLIPEYYAFPPAKRPID